IHEDLIRVHHLEEGLTSGQLPLPSMRTSDDRDRAEALLTELDVICTFLSKLEGAGWFRPVYESWVASGPQTAEWALFEGLARVLDYLVRERRRFQARPVSLGFGAPLDREIKQAIARAAAGRRPLGLL